MHTSFYLFLRRHVKAGFDANGFEVRLSKCLKTKLESKAWLIIPNFINWLYKSDVVLKARKVWGIN